jgi:hypothetical protein
LRADILVDLWLVGFLVAAALQLLWASWLASRSAWGFASGWQREIACWNIAMVALILALRSTRPPPDAVILPVLALLSLMLGTNHLIAAIRNPRKATHWAGLAGNSLGLGLYLAFLLAHDPLQP